MILIKCNVVELGGREYSNNDVFKLLELIFSRARATDRDDPDLTRDDTFKDDPTAARKGKFSSESFPLKKTALLNILLKIGTEIEQVEELEIQL